MIPKLICFIIGHKIKERVVTKTYAFFDIGHDRFLDRCPRCGQQLGIKEGE